MTRLVSCPLSREILDDLAAKHVAFLEERLTSAQARTDWVKAFAGAYDRILAMQIRDVLDPGDLAEGLGKALATSTVRDYFAPVARELNRRVLASLRSDRNCVGTYVPADARREIDAILERHDLVPDALVRKVFEQQVVIDAIDDTLYDGLMQFNTTVNPFFADWGLPSIVKRMPIGGSLILASMEALRAEFERRLEPEIRKFVAVFSRRATSEMTEAAISRSGDPKFIELRKNVVAFLYSESLAELLAGFDEDTAAHGSAAAESIALELLEKGHLVARIRDALKAFVEEQGQATVGHWLEGLGAIGRPDLEQWAELLWPHARSVLASPPVRTWLARTTAEFYDSLKP